VRSRKVVDMGQLLYDGRPHRWLSISAKTNEELDELVLFAEGKGWSQDPFYQGTDVELGWPAVWMKKEVDPGHTNDEQPSDRP
jgi:hypothetical protein